MKNQLFLLGQKQIERGAKILAPLSWIWGFVSFCKNFLYDRKWLRIARVACPVVSVGGLAAGGTGKTPLVHLLASQFPGRRIAILSRGYGKIPDEAMLLKRRLPHARIYIGKNRVRLAEQAISEGCDLIFLDDGFQYRKLHRDFDLVVLAGSDPFGKGHFLPWGFLRDSPRRLAKADAVFLSGEGTYLGHHIPLQLCVDRILDFHGQPIASIAGMDVAIFSGIAKPHLFKKTVESLGARVVEEWILADHEKAPEARLQTFGKTAQAILCTEKDFIKLRPLPLPLYFLEISYRPTSDALEKLIAKIAQKLDTFKQYDARCKN